MVLFFLRLPELSAFSSICKSFFFLICHHHPPWSAEIGCETNPPPGGLSSVDSSGTSTAPSTRKPLYTFNDDAGWRQTINR